MRIVWDQVGERIYETGTKQGVLYPLAAGKYPKGVAWNGLTAVTESPSGAEPTKLYANDSVYATMVSNEEFGGTIEAYTYPPEFEKCDGSAEVTPGVTVGQQARTPFGLNYKTTIGNDTDGTEHGYKLHLIYGAQAAPSEKSYATINENTEAITLSWEYTTTPVQVAGFKPTSSMVIDSTKVDATKLKALEEILYGKNPTTEEAGDGVEPRLPLPDEVITLLGMSEA